MPKIQLHGNKKFIFIDLDCVYQNRTPVVSLADDYETSRWLRYWLSRLQKTGTAFTYSMLPIHHSHVGVAMKNIPLLQMECFSVTLKW